MAGGSLLLSPPASNASSHREAPYITSDPQVDNTDVYAFTSPDNDKTATLVANFSPDQSPGGGPNFYPWATGARYNINVDNNGDAKPDVTFRWTFKDMDRRGRTNHGTKIPGSFLYNDGPVTSVHDKTLLYHQMYNLDVIYPNKDKHEEKGKYEDRAKYETGVKHEDAGKDKDKKQRSYRLLSNVPVAPNNVGKASFPDYEKLTQEAIAKGTVDDKGIKAFAGQRDDPFFLDIRVFDLVYGGNLSERGINSLAGKNVNTIAIQVPKHLLAGQGDVKANPVIGVWSTSERRSLTVIAKTNSAPMTSESRASDTASYSGPYQQVSRLGNPLVNEVVVPANLKDYFNRLTPDQDAKVPALLGRVQDPEVPALLETAYQIPNPNKVPGGADRPDLVATFLTGISKKTYPAAGIDLNGLDLNKHNANVPSEQLRLNLSTPLAATPNRLGVVGGDVQGFPNGRRPADDVLDIELQVLEGKLLPGDNRPQPVKNLVAKLGDLVDANDLMFRTSFPYLANPHAG